MSPTAWPWRALKSPERLEVGGVATEGSLRKALYDAALTIAALAQRLPAEERSPYLEQASACRHMLGFR